MSLNTEDRAEYIVESQLLSVVLDEMQSVVMIECCTLC